MEVTKRKSADELTFTTDGKSELSKRALLYHWHKILDLAEIKKYSQHGTNSQCR